MSEFVTRKITDSAGTGAPSFTYGLNSGGSDSGLIGKAYTSSGTEPSSPANGDLWYDSTNDKLYYYVAGAFKQITHENAAAAQNAWSGTRGLFAGGETANNGSSLNTINQIDITTTGDATDFGDLSVTREFTSGLSNQTRGVWGGGSVNTSTSYQNVMDYVTISSAGNATDFGDLTQSKSDTVACSNGTLGIFAMGFGSGSGEARYKTDIDKITIATTGNATDFGGDLIRGNRLGGAYGDLTRGIICGGYNYYSANDETIQYITYASAGDAVDFGDMTVGFYIGGAVSDATRGVMGGGSGASFSYQNVIDYITIQTTGNATDFGDLTEGRQTAAVADATYAVFNSGGASPYTNTMDYVTIQTTGNATDFGDNTATIDGAGGCSGSPS